MTLTTTIGGTSSDSYATLAEYTTRATAMGWTVTTTTAEANLRRAAIAIDGLWLQRSFGYRQYQTQAREFPRTLMPYIQGWQILPDTIPQRVKDAQMELAYLIQGGADPLATIDATVASERVKAGPVESETTYLGGKSRAQYPAVAALLQPFLASGPGQVQLVRA